MTRRIQVRFIQKPKNLYELIGSIAYKICPSYNSNPNFQADLNDIDVSIVEDFSGLFSSNFKVYYQNIENQKEGGKVFYQNFYLERNIDFSKFNGVMNGWNTKNGKIFKSTFLNSRFNKHKLNWDFSQAENLSYFMKGAKYNKAIHINNQKPLKILSNAFKESKVKSVRIDKIDRYSHLENCFINTNLNEGNINIDFSFLNEINDLQDFIGYSEKICCFNYNTNIDMLKIPHLGDWCKKLVLDENYYWAIDFWGLDEEDFQGLALLEEGKAKHWEVDIRDVDLSLDRLKWLNWGVWALKENENGKEVKNESFVFCAELYLKRFVKRLLEKNEEKRRVKLLSNPDNLEFLVSLLEIRFLKESLKELLVNLGVSLDGVLDVNSLEQYTQEMENKRKICL